MPTTGTLFAKLSILAGVTFFQMCSGTIGIYEWVSLVVGRDEVITTVEGSGAVTLVTNESLRYGSR